jgi:heptosyltransferase-2
VIRWLHKRFPLAELHFVTKSAMSPVLQHHPDLTKLHILHDHNENELLTQLQSIGFDALIDLHSNWRTLRWKFHLAPPGSGVPFLRFRKSNIRKWWMVQTKRKPARFLHTVHKYARMLEPWGIQDDGLGLDWAFDPSLTRKAAGISFLEHELGWANNQQVTAVALGSQHATKCLPKEKLVALCRTLEGPVLLLGGPKDKDLAESIVQSLERQDLVHRCGPWTLQQSAQALSECTCLITPDSGLMHIGAALRIKLFVVWGNTVPEFGMHPWLPDLPDHRFSTSTPQTEAPPKTEGSSMAFLHQPEYFEVDVPCRPCSKLGHASCPQGHFQCMMSQDVSGIARAVARFRHSFPRL